MNEDNLVRTPSVLLQRESPLGVVRYHVQETESVLSPGRDPSSLQIRRALGHASAAGAVAKALSKRDDLQGTTYELLHNLVRDLRETWTFVMLAYTHSLVPGEGEPLKEARTHVHEARNVVEDLLHRAPPGLEP